MLRFAASVRAAPRKAAPDPRDRAYVAWLQGWLNQLMQPRLTVDGQIGRQAQAAVRAFQARQSLPVDGVVGPRTERALIAVGQVTSQRQALHLLLRPKKY
jgi:peptidoglycan hydrolase-like protein with peptidoglycan-binding domain